MAVKFVIYVTATGAIVRHGIAKDATEAALQKGGSQNGILIDPAVGFINDTTTKINTSSPAFNTLGGSPVTPPGGTGSASDIQASF